MTAALAKIHIAKKELGLHEDDYRATIERLTGKTSAKDLTPAEAGRLLDEFKRRGWKPRVISGGHQSPTHRAAPVADSEHARKARALWISLWHLGAVDNKGEPALEAFAQRQVGVQKLQWMSAGEAFKLIEALKAIARRHGWKHDAGKLTGPVAVRALMRQLIEAQCAKLGRSVPVLDQKTVDQLKIMAADLSVNVRARMTKGKA